MCGLHQMKVILYLSAFILLLAVCSAENVVVEGIAENKSASSKEQALADALREAVRVGSGVNLINQSKTANFTLEYDRVFTAAFGYVRGYQVLECGVKGDGFYHVKISADVSKGDLSVNDKLALKQLIALKNSPRIGFDIQENITFVPKNSGYANAWFHQQANEMQLHVVSLEKNIEPEKIVAQGDSNTKTNQPQKIRSKVDFIIRGKVEGKYQVFDSGNDTPYSITGNFEAVNAETNEIVASINLRPTGLIKSKIESPQLAAKSVIEKCLDGDENEGKAGAGVLFRRIFARWASDLDLGRKVKVEVEEIDDKSLRLFVEKLRVVEKINAINKREFNSKGTTVIDLETRLNSDELTKYLLLASNNEYQIDYSTENIILLVKNNTPYWRKAIEFMRSKIGL